MKPVTPEYVIKELELIENIIDRMVSNSFMTKGWATTLVVATLLLRGVNEQLLIAYIPIIVFWLLDAYYLQRERMYRELYADVIRKRPEDSSGWLNMNASAYKKDVQSWPRTMFSKTLLLFYGSIVILLSAYTTIILYQ